MANNPWERKFVPSGDMEVNEDWPPSSTLSDEQLNIRLQNLRANQWQDDREFAKRLKEAEKEFLDRASKK